MENGWLNNLIVMETVSKIIFLSSGTNDLVVFTSPSKIYSMVSDIYCSFSFDAVKKVLNQSIKRCRCHLHSETGISNIFLTVKRTTFRPAFFSIIVLNILNY